MDQATGEQARAAIGDAGELAADLVAVWIANKNAAAVAAIAADDHAPSLPRKAARRGLNVLRLARRPHPRGPARHRLSRPVWRRPSKPVSAPDGGGTSAFTLGVRSEGRYRLVDVIVKAGTGIVSIAGMQISRGQLRDTFDEIEKRFRRAAGAGPHRLGAGPHRPGACRTRHAPNAGPAGLRSPS